MILLVIATSGFILTHMLLSLDKDLAKEIFTSYLLNISEDENTAIFWLSVIWPISLFQYIYLKSKIHKMKQLKNLTIGLFVLAIIGFLGDYLATELITFNNTEIELNSSFNAQKQERIAFIDKAWKQISQNSQIAIKNDSSFANLVNIVMSGQPKSLNGMFTAFKLIDPSANYEQVSSFYTSLINIVNQNREGILSQEKAMQAINREHENLLNKWPGSFYNSFFKRKHFDYVPILSDVILTIQKENKDNNVKVF